MSARPLARSIPLAAVLATVLLGGCGGGAAVQQVRVLQMNPGALVSKQARSSGSTVVRASLSGGSAQLPPAMGVPQVGSVAVGATNGGRLVKGLQLPETGPDWVTYDPILHRVPNRSDRLWATDRLLAFLLYVLRDYRLANPGAPPVVIGDLSRPRGGPFGNEFGGLGHASHQNGLDVDVYYPRTDRTQQPPTEVAQVDRALAQDLVGRFVGAGALRTFVGETVGLGGPAPVVQAIPYHDDHVHVRIANVRA